MFKPYYVAISDKEQLAAKMLSKELQPHYMKQNSKAITTHYKTRAFNAELKAEMDTIIKQIGIGNSEKMWLEMSDATSKIFLKYINKKEPLWSRFMKKIFSQTK